MSALAGILVVIIATHVGASTHEHDTSHPCARPCAADQSPEECRYIFTLQPHVTFSRWACGACPNNSADCLHPQCVTADGNNRTFFSVNRQLPGPVIQVCVGDKVEVEVRNRLPGGAEGALHWHGLSQKGSPHMDGVPMVTQCPVPPGAVFRYRFVADQEGTHFYHAHSVLQQADGVHGALVVRSPSYTHEEEHVLLIAPWNPELQSGAYGVTHGNLATRTAPTTLLLNGRNAIRNNNGETVNLARVVVKVGKPSLLRIINAAALDCPIRLNLQSHVMRVLRVGGSAVTPVNVNSMLLYPGERYDVEVQVSKPGQYKLLVEGEHACRKAQALDAVFEVLDTKTHNAITDDFPRADFQTLSSDCALSSDSVMCSLDLEAMSAPEPAPKSNVVTFSLPFGHAPVSPVENEDLEFRFVLDDVAYYPTFLNDIQGEAKTQAPHLNHVTFRLPASPPLVHPEDEAAISRNECQSLPANEQESLGPPAKRPYRACKPSPHYCECTHVLRAPLNSTVQITLHHAVSGDEDGGYSLHLHGYTFRVKRWRAGTESEWCHVTSPVARDTVAVPRGGAVTLQLQAENPGFWLLEARAGHVASAGVGVAAILQVGDRSQMPAVPENFPRCSGIRPNDVIF